MARLIPSATYTSPSEPEEVLIVPGDGPHSTNGETTRISDIVVKAGGSDRDRPSEAKESELGSLRASLTTLQDKLNDFLTLKMKRKLEDDDIEKRVLDNAVDEDSD